MTKKRVMNKVRKPAAVNGPTLAWVIGDLRRRAQDARQAEKEAGKMKWHAAALAAEATSKAFDVAASELARHDQFPVLR